MKAFLVLLLLLSFISCGSDLPHWKDLTDSENSNSNDATPEKIVEAVMPELLNKEGCDILYPQLEGDIIAVISCDSGESYLLYDDGSFIEGDASDIELVNGPDDEEDENDEISGPIVGACDEELIINGSFEEGHNLGNNKWGLFESLPGWYANTLKRDAAIEVQNGMNIGGLTPSEGTAKIELDAHNKDGFTKSDVVVVQDIISNANETYILSFDYSARIANNKKTNKAHVFWNGKKVANLNSKQVGWKTYSIQVKSISNIQRLEFIGKQDSDTVGGYVDNVSLKRVCN